MYLDGYDSLIYSIGFLVGWPVITFLMAERLHNLGRFTFADVAAYGFAPAPIRAFAASGTLVVVAFYLIAQMVGAGQRIKLLFGLEYWIAVVIVGSLMMVYVLFGGMKDCTTRDAAIGGFLGLITAVALTVVSNSVWVDVFGNNKAFFPNTSPALFSMTVGFGGIWLFSVPDHSARAKIDRAGYPAQKVRSETGIGASRSGGH